MFAACALILIVNVTHCKMFGRIGAFGAQLATTVVFLTHIAVEKASDAGLATPPVLVGAAVAVCGTSYVVKKIHRRNLHNRNNRRSSKQQVSCVTYAAFGKLSRSSWQC